MSIAYQAEFWLRNVCDSSLKAVQQRNKLDETIRSGLSAFRELLKNIYRDYHSFETSTAERVPTKIGIPADDLENYHHLTETIECLYLMAKTGFLETEGSDFFLTVTKNEFKRAFKKSIVFPFKMLERHSFYFRFQKQEEEVAAYRQCDKFRVYYDDQASLIQAVKYFVQNIEETNVREDYARTSTLFFIADYDSVLLKESTKRREVSPKRLGIFKTAGSKESLWLMITQTLTDKLQLPYDISLNPYVFPSWSFKYLYKKKTLCTFIIGPDLLSVRLPLPYKMAKSLIEDRKNLPHSIQVCIENFGCVHCGKCVNESNIEVVDSISLCTLNYSNFATEDSRIIAVELAAKSDTNVILRLIQNLITFMK